MEHELRFKIISEGLKNGVSITCRKYNISRTIFYRWLKRYKTLGIEGLHDLEKEFVPANKTDIKIEQIILNLIKSYPQYGPKAIKYLLDDLGHKISESAVFNVMKRHNLTNKAQRIQFVKKSKTPITLSIPKLSDLKSGECWIFWITDYGNIDQIGSLYEYTFFDFKSRIACTRLYNTIAFENFEDLLSAVAMPVATTMNFKPRYLCFYKDVKLIKQSKHHFKSSMTRIIQDNGLDVQIHILNPQDEIDIINQFKENYTEGCLSFIMPLIQKGISFNQIKLEFQNYVRHYNLNHYLLYNQDLYTPVEYHNLITNTKLILPICVYLDREY